MVKSSDSHIAGHRIQGLQNLLIERLTPESRNAVLAAGRVVSHPSGMVLHEPSAAIDYLTFPVSGLISMLAVMADGRTIETASIGSEGVMGGFGIVGMHRFYARALVSLPLVAISVSRHDMRNLIRQHPDIQDVLTGYIEALLAQLFTLAPCNALHSVEARFCRWILRASDQLGSDEVPITQDMLSQILGVRRASVTGVAGHLEKAGIISLQRARVNVIDRARLESAACECRDKQRYQVATAP